jgi:hypothetical protein
VLTIIANNFGCWLKATFLKDVFYWDVGISLILCSNGINVNLEQIMELVSLILQKFMLRLIRLVNEFMLIYQMSVLK